MQLHIPGPRPGDEERTSPRHPSPCQPKTCGGEQPAVPVTLRADRKELGWSGSHSPSRARGCGGVKPSHPQGAPSLLRSGKATQPGVRAHGWSRGRPGALRVLQASLFPGIWCFLLWDPRNPGGWTVARALEGRRVRPHPAWAWETRGRVPGLCASRGRHESVGGEVGRVPTIPAPRPKATVHTGPPAPATPHPAPTAVRPPVPSAPAPAPRGFPGLLRAACANTNSKDNARDNQVAATKQAVPGQTVPGTLPRSSRGGEKVTGFWELAFVHTPLKHGLVPTWC